MIRRVLAIVLSMLATALVPRGLAQEELEDTLRQAEKGRQEYVDTFRDLTAVETWVTEILNPNGTTDKRRTVVSDFFVYRSTFKNDVVREYRITREVDGKPAGRPVDQAMKLFRALSAAKTLEQEQAALEEQNFRYILRFIVWGLTVDPFWEVQSDRRQSFIFAPSGRQRLGDRDAIVLAYEAKEFRSMQPTVLFKHFNNPRSGTRGTAWLDAKDWRLHRWVNDVMVVDDEITTEAVLMHLEIDYERSALGVLPRRIAVSTFDKSADKKTPQMVRPVIRQSFTYEGFKRFEVTTATEIENPKLR
jgi:hypothetical protein